MNETNVSVAGWSASGAYTLWAVAIGLGCFIAAVILIPKLVDRLTPLIDEQREIAKGNRAVAEYFGRIVSACIIGVSIIIAAAIIAGLH